MASVVEIQKVSVGPKYLSARVRIADGAPLTTDADLVGTTRIYNLMPSIIDHACMGDGAQTFKDAMGATEVAHVLEHVAVELIARCDHSEARVTAGRTEPVSASEGGDGRTFEVRLSCPDDVLVAAALSSAAFIVDWAYSGGEGPEPGIDAIVGGLIALVDSLPQDGVQTAAQPAAQPAN